MRLSPHELAYVAETAGFSGEDLVTAVAVALAESGGDTEAMGRSDSGTSVGNRDHGLWQISGRWHGMKLQATWWRNPYANAQMAFKIWNDAGQKWTPWAVFNSGIYEKYLPDARIAVQWPWRPPY
jgi:Lysozyme like domain